MKPITKFTLVTRSCYLKTSIPDALHGHSCNNCVALRPDFFETLIFRAEQFSATFPSRLLFEIQLYWNRSCSTSSLSRGIPLYYWGAEINILIHRASFLLPSAKFHFHLKTVRGSCNCPVIRNGFWPLHSPDLTPCCFYLWRSAKGKVCKTDQHTSQDLRNKIRLEISTIFGPVSPDSIELAPPVYWRQTFQHLL